VQGTVRVLECARAAQVDKFVYAASSSCYGLAETPTREDHLIAPQYPYALSKFQGEQAAFHWHQVYDLPVNSICIFNAYGPRVRTTGVYGAVFGVFFRQRLAGKPYTVVGDGSQKRDFVHARDIAEAFLLAAESPVTGERFNVGGGNPQSINYLVELLGGPVTYVPKRPGEPEVTFADIRKVADQLGWASKIKFEDGVRHMLTDIERWRDAPLWDPDSIAAATKTWFRYLGNQT
jgi:UDP-glucose 4-epimerase